jgi:CRISPR system Cascade subunit CasE
MILSRVELDTHRSDTLRALARPNILHGAVEAAYPGKRDDRRVLWRVDTLANRTYLLMLAPEKADPQQLLSQFAPDGATGDLANYAALLGRMQVGQRWSFRLRANPVHSVSQADGARSKVYAHVTPAHQELWLRERAPANGFALEPDGFHVVGDEWLRFDKARGRTVALRAVTYEGLLLVTDAELLRQAIAQGIGRAKAYGCGLLTLAAIGNNA